MRHDHLRNPATTAFSGTDVWRFATAQAARLGDRPFVAWRPFDGADDDWSYRRMIDAAAATAAGMQQRGVRRGDRVVVHLDNAPEFVVAWLACAAAGAVAVTTNTRSAADELAYFAEDSAAGAAITSPGYAELIARSMPGLRWIAVTSHDAGVPADSPIDALAFDDLAVDPAGLAPGPVDPWAPMGIQYTSGTTARPKGVVWTHANALWAGRCNAVHEDLHPDDRHLLYLPLFHANALGYSLLPSLWVGAGLTLWPKWSTPRFWDVSMRERTTFLSLIGLSMRSLLTGATGDVPDGHAYRLLGGPLCDTPLDALLGVKTIGWWGMTETIGHGIVGNPYTPDRPMTLGRAAPEYGICVVDDDLTTPTEVGVTGNLLFLGVPGLTMFAEYLNQPRATADSFDEHGWFRTGDRVTVLDDGYLAFADRSKDMLKVGAENVAASEVERVIMESGVVMEAAVVGRPDDKLDEVPVAFVVASGGDRAAVAEAVRQACRDRLADFKVPREVHVVAELPRSTLAKVNKAVLRRIAEPDAAARLAAAEAEWLEAARRDPSGDASLDDAAP